MLIKTHQKAYSVELEDGSRWLIWPPDTLHWSPSTDLDVLEIDDSFSTHALGPGRTAGSRHQRGRKLDPEANAREFDCGRVRAVSAHRLRSRIPYSSATSSLMQYTTRPSCNRAASTYLHACFFSIRILLSTNEKVRLGGRRLRHRHEERERRSTVEGDVA